MLKLIVVGLASFGAACFLGRVFPGVAAVAFFAAGYGVTWLAIACTGVGLLTYRITK